MPVVYSCHKLYTTTILTSCNPKSATIQLPTTCCRHRQLYTQATK